MLKAAPNKFGSPMHCYGVLNLLKAAPNKFGSPMHCYGVLNLLRAAPNKFGSPTPPLRMTFDARRITPPDREPRPPP